MSIEEARTYAVQKLWENGLGQKGWKVTFNDRLRANGYCDHNTRTISLSRKHLAARSVEGTKNTILHEVAHALVRPVYNAETGRWDRHSDEWRACFIRLGGTGETRSKDPALKPVLGKYTRFCPTCGVSEQLGRMPTRVYSCSACHPSFNRAYAFHVKENATGRLVPIVDRPRRRRQQLRFV